MVTCHSCHLPVATISTMCDLLCKLWWTVVQCYYIRWPSVWRLSYLDCTVFQSGCKGWFVQMVPSKLFKMRSISRHNTSLVPRHSKSLEMELAQHRLKYYQQTQTFCSRFCLTAFGSLYSNSPPSSAYSAYAPLEQFSSWNIIASYDLLWPLKLEVFPVPHHNCCNYLIIICIFGGTIVEV